MSIQKTIRHTAIVAAALFLVAACGGGGGGDSAPPSGNTPPPAAATGTVGLFIKDAPTEEFDEILATITSIELLGEGGGATLFSGDETIDLLQLENFSELFAVATDVPAAGYNKIRLILSDLTLVRKDENDEVVESASVKLPGNGKVDLNPRGTISVVGGGTLLIELDIDAKKSIKVTGSGNGEYLFRPVVFVNIMEVDVPETLARVHGEVGAVDPVALTFELCQSDLVSDPDGGDGEGDNGTGEDGLENCMLVATDGDTGIFDNNGDPTNFDAIVTGDFLTAIGFFRVATGEEAGEGMNGLVLDAVTIELGELGTFASLKGTISADLDAMTGEFGLDIAPGQDFGDEASVTALLQPGTRVFDNTGMALDESALVVGNMGQFEGVLSLTDDVPELLKTSLIVLASGPDVGEVLSGEILTLNEGGDGFMMTTAEGDRCVIVDAETDIVLVTVSGDGLTSEPGMFSDLMAGLSVEVFGEEDEMGCFLADTVSAEIMADVPSPLADAGADQQVAVGDTVTLDGSNSSDAEDDVLSYSWTLTVPEGSAAMLSDAASVGPSFTADVVGDYTAELVVNDGMQDSAADSVLVTAAVALDGVALYGGNCEACHGILAESEKTGASAVDIQEAIDSNTGNMGTPELLALTPEEIAAIAEALQ